MAQPPFQFGLKAVFLAVTAVAVILGTWPYLALSLVAFPVIWVAVVAIGNLLEHVINGLQRLARLAGPPKPRRSLTTPDVIEAFLELHQQVLRTDIKARAAIAYLNKINQQLADGASTPVVTATKHSERC